MSEGYNFFPDATEIITSAFEVIRVYDADATAGTVTTNQRTRALKALNYMLSAWQTDGMQLWARKTTSFPLVEDQTSYSIGSGGDVNVNRPLKIYNAWIRNTTSDLDVPLQIYTEKEYDNTNNKSESGTPIAIYYDPRYESNSVQEGATAKGLLYVYKPADAYNATNCEIHIRYQRPFNNFDAQTDNIDFPQEWMEAVKYGLAVRLAPLYGVPMLEYDRLKHLADQLKMEVLGYDTEYNSLRLQPRFS